MSEGISFKAIVKTVCRYLSDKTSLLADVETTDIFDVTLKCGARETRFVLHPKLNSIVYRGLIKPGSCVEVDNHYSLIDELNIRDRDIQIFVIEELRVTNGKVLRHDKRFPFARLHTNVEEEHTPLTTRRKYYMALLNNEDITDHPIWKGNALSTNIPNVSLTIAQLNERYTNNALAKPLPPVTGTVVTKSRLSHYGRTSDYNRCPFVFSIEIESGESSCCVTFWNSACFTHFRSVHVGQTVVLKNYRLKPRFGERSNTVYPISKASKIELSINSEKPKGEVLLAPQTADVVPYRFVGRAFSDGCIVDVVGVIRWVGRYEREVKQQQGGGTNTTGDYCMYRWIGLYRTEEESVYLKIYSCSQSHVLDHYSCGDVFVGARFLTKLTVVSLNGKQRPFRYLVTTKESQLYRIERGWTVQDISKLPFAKYQEVLDALMLQMDNQPQSTTGGWFAYPPLTDCLDTYLQHSEHMVVSMQQLNNVCRELHVYERRAVSVQATIEMVHTVDWTHDDHRQPQLEIEQLYMCDGFEYENQNLTIVGETDPTRENFELFMGTCEQGYTCLHVALLGCNRDVVVFAFVKPDIRTYYYLGGALSLKTRNFSSRINSLSRLLFHIELFNHGNNRIEVVINRAFKLPVSKNT